jgi:prefoldin subunit 5|tara:strand:+ start:1404 stop:1607 length:204 start_codon:yes stop_codon:yes gene_type:complete
VITVDSLKERKTTIEEDIKKVEDALKSLDEQRVSLQANLFALQGALQQVDFFISDEENDKDKKKETK